MSLRYVTYDRLTAVPAPTYRRLLILTLGEEGMMQARAKSARERDLPGRIVVAFNGSRAVGWNMRDREKKIEQFLDPRYRGQGIGAAMLYRSLKANGLSFTVASIHGKTPSWATAIQCTYYENARRTLRSAKKLRTDCRWHVPREVRDLWKDW